jgi:prepilin-type N-terminal cleavage/methylation domain-containing protein
VYIKSKQSGFTFIELLVALSLFVVGMLTILQIFPVNRKYLTQSGDTTQATFLAQEEMETVRSLGYEDLTVGTNPYFEPAHPLGSSSSDPFNQYTRQTEVEYIDPNTFQVISTDDHLKQVIITVTWQESNLNRQYVLSSYVYDD